MDDLGVLLSDLSGYTVTRSRFLRDRLGVELVDPSGSRPTVILELIGLVAYLDNGLVGAGLSRARLLDTPGSFGADVGMRLRVEPLVDVKELFLIGLDGHSRLRCIVGNVSYRPGPLGNDLC